MKLEEKEQARSLRKKGYSINEIVEKTGFTKSSVSLWVRDIVLTNSQMQRLSGRGRSFESIEKRRLHRLENEQTKRRVVMDEAKSDYKSISSEQLKLIGTVLYMGEGGKTNKGIVRLANSDPEIIKIMMRFLREVCHVPEEKFSGYIHTFEHANVEKTERYWSGITGIPRKQFYKTYIKRSSASLEKRNTLPFGTFDIYVCDTKLFLRIMGWIEGIKELIIG